jgi:hypothetical protein
VGGLAGHGHHERTQRSGARDSGPIEPARNWVGNRDPWETVRTTTYLGGRWTNGEAASGGGSRCVETEMAAAWSETRRKSELAICCLPVPAVRRVPRFLLPFPSPWTLVVRRWVGPRDWWVRVVFSFLLLGSEEVVTGEEGREGKGSGNARNPSRTERERWYA